MSTKQPLKLVVSLDVEEEGLFGGSYCCRQPSIRNTAQLYRLRPLLERGIKPTLFCAHAAFTDKPSRTVLADLRDTYGAEIGAHLHHWNTPPLSLPAAAPSAPEAPAQDSIEPPAVVHSVPSAAVPLPLMAAKLASLFAAGHDFQGAPLSSFRMGRWDLHRQHWPLLAEAGVHCDASVRPLHGRTLTPAGLATTPDHFDAPAAPYWVPVGQKQIFEVPCTVTPLFPALPACVAALPKGAAALCRSTCRQWGALALLPVEHPLWAMKAITRRFVQRGGTVLSLTWHSSEMMPAACPHLPDVAAVEALMTKITAYVDWLQEHWQVQCLTMDALRVQDGPHTPVRQSSRSVDWTTACPESASAGCMH